MVANSGYWRSKTRSGTLSGGCRMVGHQRNTDGRSWGGCGPENGPESTGLAVITFDACIGGPGFEPQAGHKKEAPCWALECSQPCRPHGKLRCMGVTLR